MSLEWLLAYDLLWCHHHRKVAYSLPRDPDARQREMQQRLQLLIDGNYINYRGGDGKLRLQFLGVRLRPPEAVPPDFNAMEPVFSNRMVHVETMREELRRDRRTARVRTEHLEQTANWIRPWAVCASAGHSVSVSTVMELDPSKFALSASMSLLGQIKGAYHATEIYNLNLIVTEGLKTGSDMMELGRTSGRLHSYFGIFPPWDSRNKLTRSRSRTDQRTPLVTLYVPIVDLVREGGRVTENGAVICERTVPFHMVKEMWLCIPGSAPYGKFEEIEKILDDELEDEICSEIEQPLTPAANEMHCHRTLERILELLCELPNGPHDGTKAGIISQLSEYFGVDWSQTDWSRYDALYDEVVEFVILHTPPPTEARTSRDRNIRFRICPWCLKNTPSCLARCTFCFSVFISRGTYQRVEVSADAPMDIPHDAIARAREEAANAVDEDEPMEDEPQPEVDQDNDVAMGGEDVRLLPNLKVNSTLIWTLKNKRKEKPLQNMLKKYNLALPYCYSIPNSTLIQNKLTTNKDSE